MTTLDHDGARIHFDVAGPADAPALLLLHAGVATSAMWEPQWLDLARDHRLVRYDLRGFGRTETDDVEFSNRSDAIAVLDAAGVERATLIGSSRGGYVAIDTAVEFPHRVSGLMVTGSAASGMPFADATADELASDEQIESLLEEGRVEEALRREVELWWVGPRRTPADVDPAFLETGYRDNLAIPMLFAVGDEDLSSEIANARSLADAAPGSEHHVFTGAAHLPNVEQPEEFTRVLRDWLARHGL